MFSFGILAHLFAYTVNGLQLKIYQIIHEALRHYVRRDVLGRVARPFSIMLMLVLLVVGSIYIDRIYTAITFLCTAAMLARTSSDSKSPVTRVVPQAIERTSNANTLIKASVRQATLPPTP